MSLRCTLLTIFLQNRYRRFADADSPMFQHAPIFQHAPMLPISDPESRTVGHTQPDPQKDSD